jgi:hypothetical protein
MGTHVIADIKDYDISEDGRKIILHLADISDMPVSLDFGSLLLEKLHYEIGLAITKARQLSEFERQNIVSIFRPSHSRADLEKDGKTVVISFRAGNGLEVHYGLEPNHASLLARQIQDAAEQGMSAKPPTAN